MTSHRGEESGASVAVYHGETLASYGFGEHHPFGSDRLAAFWDGAHGARLRKELQVRRPVSVKREDLERFHTPAYVDLVAVRSREGVGFLDYGDTPAFPGVFEAASFVVGSVVDAVHQAMNGEIVRAFIPVAGLHHARRDRAGGFCVFNDCGVAIELLREEYGLKRIAYIDIDAHHGDGVYYAFEEDPEVFIADIHEDGRYLYPGTGAEHETGRGNARGTKLNLPLSPGADDREFLTAWTAVEERLKAVKPEFVLLQCGADGLAGDPLAHLRYTEAAHRNAAETLCRIADEYGGGRLLAMGGGGYNHANLDRGWWAVVKAMLS